jgi:DNA repair protein RadC
VNQLFGIKSWANEDRPREKLEGRGRSALSDAELLAILINSGTKSMTALDIAKSLLASIQGDLNKLSRMSIAELCKYEGLGKARAVTIISAMELCRRRRPEGFAKKNKITCSKDIYLEMRSHLEDQDYEQFWMLSLNRANNIIQKSLISKGGLTSTVADPRKIYNIALENKASGVILCHNHPSGNLIPSDADISLTRKLKTAGKYLDIDVLDHIIFGDNAYYSFADQGKM